MPQEGVPQEHLWLESSLPKKNKGVSGVVEVVVVVLVSIMSGVVKV